MQDSMISRVTVLEDRAVVERRATVEVSPGDHQFKFGPLAHALVKKSAVARLLAAGSARVLDVRAELEMVQPQPDAQLAEDCRRVERQVLELANRGVSLQQESESAAKLLSQLRAEACLDAAWGRFEPEQAQRSFEELMQWQESLRVKKIEVENEFNDLRRHLKSLRQRQLEEGQGRLQSFVLVSLKAEQQESLEIELEYVTAGAAWRPYHQAALTGEQALVSCQGCVWQNTGEDWTEVELRLSTRRPSLGTEPPPLQPDWLFAGPRSTTRTVEVREQKEAALSDFQLPAGPPSLPGVDDGGEVRRLEASRPVTVPGDGQAVRVPLFEFESEVQLQRVLYPELSTAVILKGNLSNEASLPLLAGPVDLIRDGAFIGRSQLGYVAAGEKFELGWGADTRVSVHRKSFKGEDKEKKLSGWVRSRRTVTVKLGSLSDQPIDLTLTERIPVSEVKEVEVELESDSVSDGMKADEDGFVTWQITLGPRQRRTFELAYLVKKRKDVVGV